MKSWCNIFQKTNCLTCSQLPFAKLESKRAANLCFHLCEAVKERTVSCHGCELVDLGSVKATTFFFSEVRPLSVISTLPNLLI